MTSLILAADPSLFIQWRDYLGPFHPVILHLPIGLLLGALVLEIIRLFTGQDEYDRPIRVLLGCTVLSSVLAILTGLAWFYADGYGEKLEAHLWSALAFGVLALFTWLLKKRHLRLLTGGSYGQYWLVLLITLGVLGFTSHEGGENVHGDPFKIPPPPLKQLFVQDPEVDPVPPVEPLDPVATNIVLVVETPFFVSKVVPILGEYCIDCHGAEKQKGDVRLDTREWMLGNEDEEILNSLIPGNALESYMYTTMVLPEDDKYHMPPPKKPQPSAEDIALIKWWIDAGADTEKTAAELQAPKNFVPATPTTP